MGYYRVICRAKFPTCRSKKNHKFLFHYGKHEQFGGSRQADLPLNILKRGSITYYSENFDQHKEYYDFFCTDMIDVFLDNVYQTFCSQNNMYKFQGYFEIVNQQRAKLF